MRVTRRNFIKAMGAGAVTMALPGCTGPGIAPTGSRRPWSERREEWKSAVCRLCSGGCGLKVRVIDGRAVQVLGNRLHPVNRGGICPRGVAAVEQLYDPDRLRRPMERAGARGDGHWQAISAEDALARLAEKLRGIRSSGTPESLLILDGQESGVGERIAARFARAYGTPNLVRYRWIEPERISLAHGLMQGGEAPIGIDITKASFLLCFGTDLLESWHSPVSQMRNFGDLRGADGGLRAQVVVVDSRFSKTASRADRWIPIRPGAYGALAMGIAHVILRESMHDRAFIRDRTFGFDDWTDSDGVKHTGFATLALTQYSPRVVEEITGVRSETILSLARGFASTKPALAVGEPEFSWSPLDFYDRMAIHALNALTGNLTGTGAFVVQGRPPTADWPAIELDGTAQRSLAQPRIDGAGAGKHLLAHDAVQSLPDRIMEGKPYPVAAVLLIDANPLFSHPAKSAFEKAIAHAPFIASVSSYLDESAGIADLVFPMRTILERWELLECRRHAGFSLASVGEPAVEPAAEAFDPADLILATAERIGGAVAAALPWRSTREVVEHAARGLFDANRGYVVAEPVEEAFRRILERQGFRDPEFASFDQFWRALLARGAWWDPTDSHSDPSSLIRTESGRFEFYSLRLARAAREEAARRDARGPSGLRQAAAHLRKELGSEADGDEVFLPHFEKTGIPSTGDGYDLRLQPYLLLSLGMGGTANLPWIQESLSVELGTKWESWVELNPLSAEERGVRDGEPVWIVSAEGRVKARVRLFEGTAPGIVSMPLGQGRRAGGRHAKGRGANPLDLVSNLQDSRAGMGVLGLTPVRIEKA